MNKDEMLEDLVEVAMKEVTAVGMRAGLYGTAAALLQAIRLYGAEKVVQDLEYVFGDHADQLLGVWSSDGIGKSVPFSVLYEAILHKLRNKESCSDLNK